jgi:APA family basic amino acid/polyamine antiporter
MKLKRSIGLWTAIALGVVVATLAFGYSVWAIAGAGEDIVTKGFVLLLCGIPVYVGMRWWEGRKAEHLEVPAPAAAAPPELVAGGDRAR